VHIKKGKSHRTYFRIWLGGLGSLSFNNKNTRKLGLGVQTPKEETGKVEI
jgi:hypothetical protein